MDVQPQADLKAYAERLEVLCRAQADEINRLRDAVACDRGRWSFGDAPKSVQKWRAPRIVKGKCAGMALAHESPSLKPIEAPLELVAEVIEPLATVVERQRKRANAILALPLAERERMIAGVVRRDGNGSDDDTGS